MPATSCTNPVVFDLSKDNGQCEFIVELAYDGVSVPPNCDGTVNRVHFHNTGQLTWYAHLPQTRLGKAVYRIDPGASRNITSPTILQAAGLVNRSDILGAEGLDLNQVPPAVDETLIN